MLQRNRKGFTLLELLAVLIILAALSCIGVAIFANKLDEAKQIANKQNIALLQNQAMSYLISENTIPLAGTNIIGDMLDKGYIREIPKYSLGDGTYKVTIDANGHPVVGVDAPTPPNQPVIVINPTGYTANVRANITYSDNSTNKLYRIDGGSWNAYTGELNITTNCLLEAKATNENGESNIASLNITNIDSSIPQTPTIEASPTILTNGDVTVSITSEDSETKYYKIDSGSWITYTIPFTVNSNCTVYAKEINAATRESATSSRTISNIDKEEPTATIEYSTTAITKGNVVANLIGASEEITVTNNSGLTTYTFTTNGSFTFNFVDAAGNIGSAIATVNNIDKIAPDVPTIVANPTTLTQGNVTITINCSDNTATKYYKIDEGSWTLYSGAFTVSSNCTIYAKAIDAATNESTEASLSIVNIVVPPVFSGLGPEVFDHDYNTFASATSGTVTWTGDAEGKVITIKFASYNTSYTMNFNVLDLGGANLSFTDADTGALYTTLTRKSSTPITVRFIVPTGAKSFKFTGNNVGSIFEVEVASDLIAPGIITNTSYTSTDCSVTLNWTNPIDADFNKVAIYRDGIFLTYSPVGATTYMDKPLYSNMTYNYTIYALDTTGNQSSGVDINTITQTPAIIWRGLDPNAFDHDTNTYFSTGNGTATWTGDLDGRVVTIKFASYNTSVGMDFTILDAGGATLSFTDADTGTSYTTYQRKSGTPITVRFIVPTGAKGLKFAGTGGYAGSIYDIEAPADLTIPGSVTNTSYTSTDCSVTLNWTNPADADFNKVAIYKNGAFLAYSTVGATTYLDKPLYSNMTYNYTLYALDTTGNPSTGVNVSATTQTPAIIWRGLDPNAFDHDTNTFYSTSGGTVTWTGNLDGRVVTIKFASYNSTYYMNLTMLDSGGATLSYSDADSGTSYTTYQRKSATPISLRFIVPTGAKSIKFTGNNVGSIYDVEANSELTVPADVTGVNATTTTTSVTLNWTNPVDGDFSKVAIYRNGTFVAFSTAGATSYTNTGLTTATSYTYTLYATDTTGNRATGVQYTISTN